MSGETWPGHPLTIACKKCAVWAGAPCVTPTSRPARSFHRQRYAPQVPINPKLPRKTELSRLIDPVAIAALCRWIGRSAERALKVENAFKALIEGPAPNWTGSCWTLVVTFGRRRAWGFWTPAGFVDWRTYTGAAPDYDPLEDLAPLPDRS